MLILNMYCNKVNWWKKSLHLKEQKIVLPPLTTTLSAAVFEIVRHKSLKIMRCLLLNEMRNAKVHPRHWMYW